MKAKLIAMHVYVVFAGTFVALMVLAYHVAACAYVADRCITSHPYDPKATCAAPGAQLGPAPQDAGP